LQDLLCRTAHHYVLSKIFHSELAPDLSTIGLKGKQISTHIIGLQRLKYFPVDHISRNLLADNQRIDTQLPNQPVFQKLGYKFGMPMSAELRRNALGAFEIIVDFLAVENIEDELSAGMHEVLVYVVHIVVDYDVADALVLVVIELFLLL
jgi:hypothetical protein